MVPPATADRATLTAFSMNCGEIIEKELRSSSADHNHPTSQKMANQGQRAHNLFADYVSYIKQWGKKSREKNDSLNLSPDRADLSTLADSCNSPLLQQSTNLQQNVSCMDDRIMTMEKDITPFIEQWKVPAFTESLVAQPPRILVTKGNKSACDLDKNGLIFISGALSSGFSLFLYAPRKS